MVVIQIRLLKDAGSSLRIIIRNMTRRNKLVGLIVLVFLATFFIVWSFLSKSNIGCYEVFTTDEEWPPGRSAIYLDEDGLYCEDNWFDCSDFCTRQDAQKVLEDCYNDSLDHDVHKLDKDDDGVACESLL